MNAGGSASDTPWRAAALESDRFGLTADEIEHLSRRHGVPSSALARFNALLTTLHEAGIAYAEADRRRRYDPRLLKRIIELQDRMEPIARELLDAWRELDITGRLNAEFCADAETLLTRGVSGLRRELDDLAADRSAPFVHSAARPGPPIDPVRRLIVWAALDAWKEAGSPLSDGRDDRGEKTTRVLAFVADVLKALRTADAPGIGRQTLREDLADYAEGKPPVTFAR